MNSPDIDSQLDQLVALFSDRLTAGEDPRESELLARLDPEHRPALERCFRMIRAGVEQGTAPARGLAPGMDLGGFRLERLLGSGGMAQVYLAHQQELDRPVALKVLRPGLALDPRHVQRFRREALAVGRLQHPHIVQVYRVGEAEGHHYIAMEYIDGPNLAQILDRLATGPPWSAQDLAQAAGIPLLAEGHDTYEQALAALLEPVVRAVGVAHEIGIIHRDLKPSNILVNRDGRAMVADFGLARGENDPGLSLTGQPLGTPYYMSPEQVQQSSQPIDARTDVYSLGVTLYEALTGQRPFEGDSALAVFEAIRNEQATPLRQRTPSLSLGAELVVQQAMNRELAERCPSALELGMELAALRDGRPPRALHERRPWWRRRLMDARSFAAGGALEYRSAQTLLGLPLVHVNFGPRRKGGAVRRAKGWLAIGNVAMGGLAVGNLALGVVSVGALSSGLCCIGGLALGALAVGGVAAGAFAFGGLAVGAVALGGAAYGYFAAGGSASGMYVLSPKRIDPEALHLFRDTLGPLTDLLGFSVFDR